MPPYGLTPKTAADPKFPSIALIGIKDCVMLCDPVLYVGVQPVLFAGNLSNGQNFAIQHFSIDHDLQRLYIQFLRRVGDWEVDATLEEFRASFRHMAASHTSQAFIASVDATPIFEIEVHDAVGHQPNLAGLLTRQGDFILNIAAGLWNKTILDVYAEAFGRCAEYFLEFPEVRRLLVNAVQVPDSVAPSVLGSSRFLPGDEHSDVYVRDRR